VVATFAGAIGIEGACTILVMGEEDDIRKIGRPGGTTCEGCFYDCKGGGCLLTMLCTMD
jgi:hypothetical protein